jgi:hypothetical protein
MKHAGSTALDQLRELLEEIRKHTALKEKKRGIFYMKSSAFLHFHEDPAGLFADLRAGSGWERVSITTNRQKKTLLSRLRALVKSMELDTSSKR